MAVTTFSDVCKGLVCSKTAAVHRRKKLHVVRVLSGRCKQCGSKAVAPLCRGCFYLNVNRAMEKSKRLQRAAQAQRDALKLAELQAKNFEVQSARVKAGLGVTKQIGPRLPQTAIPEEEA